MKRLLSSRGETLVETLVAILMIVIIFAAMSSVAVSSAHIIKTVRETDNSFNYSAENMQEISVTMTWDITERVELNAKQYRDNDYYYYEPIGETPGE